MKLSPADRAYYTLLRQQADRAQDETFRSDPHPDAKIKYAIARRELSAFVSQKRMEGYDI